MHTLLGLNFGHDGAAALISGNKLRAAISNERISRVKKAMGVSKEMLQYLFASTGLTLANVEAIAFSSYLYSPDNYIKLFTPQGVEVKQHLFDLFGGESVREFRMKIEERLFRAFFVNHHVSHSASAFYTSPFDQAACLSVDASGRHPEACSLYCYGMGNKLHYYYCPGIMMGNAYDVITEHLGLGPGLLKAGTTMGLAPYGAVSEIARSRALEFGASYYERKFQESDLVFINYLWGQLSGMAPVVGFPKEKSDSKEAMDIAASLQHIFEETLLKFTDQLYTQTKSFHHENLCLSGGSFLNSNANMRILRESSFKMIHLFPGCGDDGTAVGAALYLNHHLLNNPRVDYRPGELMYLGHEYEISPVVTFNQEPYQAAELAREISNGKIVAWFNGRSEYGPRALGNRSLLADPRSPSMRDTINQRIKKREWFRPFAPTVLAEKSKDWFEIDVPSPYMLYIAKVKQAERIPAVVHIDGTARLQTLEREDNPMYYDLIAEFEKHTGVPVLLDTSLNVNNEPLVETPDDALRFFNQTDTDLLVLSGSNGATLFRK